MTGFSMCICKNALWCSKQPVLLSPFIFRAGQSFSLSCLGPSSCLPLLCCCFLGLLVSVTVNTLATWHRSTFLLDRAHREGQLYVCVQGGKVYSLVTPPCMPPGLKGLSEHTRVLTRSLKHSPRAEIKHRFNLWHCVQTGLFAGEESLLGRTCV